MAGHARPIISLFLAFLNYPKLRGTNSVSKGNFVFRAVLRSLTSLLLLFQLLEEGRHLHARWRFYEMKPIRVNLSSGRVGKGVVVVSFFAFICFVSLFVHQRNIY